ERAHPIVNGPVAVGVLLGVGSMLLVLILLLARYPKTGPQWSGSSWLSGRLKVMRAGLRHTVRPGMVIGSFLFALAVWGSMLACVTLFQLALGSPLSVDGCFRAAVAISVVSLLPVHAPMTIGTGEAAWTGIMVASGMAMEPAILMALGIRVLSLVLLSVDSGMGALLFGLRGGSGVSPAGGGGAADARP
ncbi:MAG: lysylphosphatidylglycerol synthase domain-containing protein, partial [Myxococcota bacterium]